MRYAFLLCFFISSGFLFNCFAQSDSGRVTVIYSKVEYKRTNKDPKDQKIYNLVKINPLLIFNGDMPIYFERRIGDQFSIEAGVGFTHMDYLYQGFVLYDDYGDLRRAKPGYSLMIAAKYYPSKYTRALDQFYFGPEIRHRRYNTEVEDCSGATLTGYISEYRILTDFKLTVGYIVYLSDNVIVDFYGGIGMRSRNINMAYCDYSGSQIMTNEPVNDMVPVFSAGIKFGFGF